MADPRTVEEWLSLADRHRRAAHLLVDDRHTASVAYQHAGFACEMALKAYLLHVERPNDIDEFLNSVRTHDLRAMAQRAGLLNARLPISAALMVVIRWNRAQDYDPGRMPRKVARSMLEASFSEKGVVTWIETSIRR